MSAGILGFGRLWPVVPGSPEDEAAPVGLAPGQMPVDPRRDGMIQPTAAGKHLSRAASVVAGNAAQGLLDAATAPKRALDGDLPIFDPATGHVSDEAMGAGAGIAGLAMTGSLPFKVPAGAVRSFGGMSDKEALSALKDLEASLGDLLAPPAPPAQGVMTKDWIGPAKSSAPPPQRAALVDPNAKSWDLYHGTRAYEDFQTFNPDIKPGHSESGAVFFAPDPKTSASYAGTHGVGDMVPEGSAGPRIFRTTVEPGKTAVFDMPHLAETDPSFNAQARALYAQEAGPRAAGLFDRYMRDFQAMRSRDLEVADQARAMGADPGDRTGISFGYGHIGAAIARAKEQGLDTAILRGLIEHGGDDQVIALTPGRVRSHYAPDQLLYAGAPVGAGFGAALAAQDEAPLIRPFGALPR